jgi:hypothetical protein
VDAERLDGADDDVCPVCAGRRKHAERDRVDPDDRLGPGLARGCRDLRGVHLDRAEKAGVLEENRRGARRELRPQVIEVEAPGLGVVVQELDLDRAVERGGAAVGPDDRQPLRADRAGNENVVAARDSRRHPDRVALGAAPAVDRQAHELHPHELAELARELEPRLVATVVGGRCAPDGSEELAAPDDLVDHSGDMVLPDAPAEEGEVALAGVVCREQLDEMPSEHGLGRHRRRER